MSESIERVRPFDTGSQFADWSGCNCERCTKGACTLGADTLPTCEIELSIGEAYLDDGRVSDETGVLMNCPFCGGEAEVDRTVERFEYGIGGPNSVMEYGYYVYCTKCGAGTGVADVPPPSEEEAVAEWNRRAAPVGASVPAEIAQTLREALIYWRTGMEFDEERMHVDAALAWLEQQRGQG